MLKLLLSLEKESMSARLLAQVRTFNLHALPELQLQGAVLVLQLQLSRPGGGGRGRKGKQNQNKHPVSRVNIISCPRAAHYYEAMKQQAPLWGRLLAGLLRADSGSGLLGLNVVHFWASMSHSSSAQKSRCLASRTMQALTAVLPLFKFTDGETLTPPWGQTPRKPTRSSRGRDGSTPQWCQSHQCLEVKTQKQKHEAKCVRNDCFLVSAFWMKRQENPH